MIDLFSGCGGMSYGFACRPPFQIVSAVDLEHGKPCEGAGTLDCNSTYAANIGIEPLDVDIGDLPPEALLKYAAGRTIPRLRPGDLTVLICCPPCTDFSRAKPANHLRDSAKNSLVVKCADFVATLRPEFVVMENARELISGNHPHHFREFRRRLEQLGYNVAFDVHMLTRYGLPQVRERALVIAAREVPVRTLGDLWRGWSVDASATTVRHAIAWLNEKSVPAGAVHPDDPMHQAPGFSSELVRERIEAVPRDGGSWFDLATHPQADRLLINSMKNRLVRNDLGSHPDVYGRPAWDRPAVTIKRE